MLTVELVSAMVPPGAKSSITQSLVDQLNAMDSDPDVAKVIRENFVSYTSVLMEGKFKVEDYINAVKFVSLHLTGLSKKDSWVRTFPERYQRLLADGASAKTISSHVAMYAGGKLVSLLTQQCQVPFHIYNQDWRQRAINTLGREMTTAKSEMVRVTAATAILQHLTPPKELVAAQININVGAESALKSMEATLTQLAQKQREAIQSGVATTKQIAASTLIVDAEVEPVR